MVLLLAATPLGGGLDAAAGSTGPAVSSWITTPDQTQLFSTGPAPTFADAPLPSGSMITVDSGQTFQTMDGFGAAITDSCLLYTSDAADEGLGVDLGGRRIIKKKFF